MPRDAVTRAPAPCVESRVVAPEDGERRALANWLGPLSVPPIDVQRRRRGGVRPGAALARHAPAPGPGARRLAGVTRRRLM